MFAFVKEGVQRVAKKVESILGYGGEGEIPVGFVRAASPNDTRGQLRDELAFLVYELLLLQMELCTWKATMREAALRRLST